MSDRIHSLTVVLEFDGHTEDVQGLVNAILLMRGVISVTPNVSSTSDHVATMRAKYELGLKVRELLKP